MVWTPFLTKKSKFSLYKRMDNLNILLFARSQTWLGLHKVLAYVFHLLCRVDV